MGLAKSAGSNADNRETQSGLSGFFLVSLSSLPACLLGVGQDPLEWGGLMTYSQTRWVRRLWLLFTQIGQRESESLVFRFYGWLWGTGALVSRARPRGKGILVSVASLGMMRLRGAKGQREAPATEVAAWAFILGYLSPKGVSHDALHCRPVDPPGLSAF